MGVPESKSAHDDFSEDMMNRPVLLASNQHCYKIAGRKTPYRHSCVEELQIKDTRRKMTLAVKVYYPVEFQGKAPIIVLSHGDLCSKDNYAILAITYAQHGYVVICPTHADSYSILKKSIKADWTKGVKAMMAQYLKDTENWTLRAVDISLILSSLGEIENNVPSLEGKLDSTRIGVAGHSLGAYGCQLLGGATPKIPKSNGGGSGSSSSSRGSAGSKKRAAIASKQSIKSATTGFQFDDEDDDVDDDDEDDEVNMRDSRVKAVVLLSPHGKGELGLTDNSWKHFNTPMMLITGEKDDPNKRDPFHCASKDNKYCVFIRNCDHGLGGIAGVTAARLMNHSINMQHCAYVRCASLAFFDAYLKDDPEAKTYLSGDNLAICSGGDIVYERK